MLMVLIIVNTCVLVLCSVCVWSDQSEFMVLLVFNFSIVIFLLLGLYTFPGAYLNKFTVSVVPL